MAEPTVSVKCPACDSDLLRWCGIEIDNDREGFADNNPAATIHKWACNQCGHEFQERID